MIIPADFSLGRDDALILSASDSLSVASLAVDGRLEGSGRVTTKSSAFSSRGKTSGSINFAFSDDVVRVGEKYDSPDYSDGDSPQSVRKFIVTGTWDVTVAYAKTMRYLSQNFQVDKFNFPLDFGWPLKSVRQIPLVGVAAHEFEATFAPRNFEEADEVEEGNYSFSTTGGTSRITHSLETISATARRGETANDYGGGININDSGGFEGVDVATPHSQINLDLSLPKGWMARPYRILLAQLTGAINSDYFDGYAPGELLFKGVNASTKKYLNPITKQKDYYWRASYCFEASQNTTLYFDEQEIVKLGWDYAWRTVEKTEDATTGKTKYNVAQINVERVYPVFPFAALCIPTPA